MVPHWPAPWGRGGGRGRADRHRRGAPRRRGQGARPRHHGLEHHDGQPVRHAGPGRALGLQDADGRVRLVPALQRARRRLRRRGGHDAGHAGRRGLEGQRPEGLDQRRPVLPSRSGHGAHRSRRAEARRHHDHGDRHARARRRGAAAAPDHRATQTSTRSSSTTCSCPTTTSSGRRTTAGRWPARRSGNERVSIGGGTGGIFRAMDLLALLKSGGDRSRVPPPASAPSSPRTTPSRC